MSMRPTGHGRPDDAPPKAAAGQACPICGRPATPAYRPFCSRRCADVDLNRWLSGTYIIPGEEAGASKPDPVQGSGASDPEDGC